ncbi:MAG: hypothetical protein P8010_17155 [Desulfosarcinaceae bacterium]
MKKLIFLIILLFLLSCAAVKQEPCGSVGMPGFDMGYAKDEFGISTYWGPANIHCAPIEVQKKAKAHHPDWF